MNQNGCIFGGESARPTGKAQKAPAPMDDFPPIFCDDGPRHRSTIPRGRRNARKFQIAMTANDFAADLAAGHLVQMPDAVVYPQAVRKRVAAHAAVASDEGGREAACAASSSSEAYPFAENHAQCTAGILLRPIQERTVLRFWRQPSAILRAPVSLTI